MSIRMIVEGINDPEGTAGRGLPIPVSTIRWQVDRAAAPILGGDDGVAAEDGYEFSAVDLQTMQVDKPIDGMTPWLFAAATTPGKGRRITLVLDTETGGAALETRISLGDAVITGYGLTGHAGSMTESLTIVYRRVELAVAHRDAEGAVGEAISAAYPT